MIPRLLAALLVALCTPSSTLGFTLPHQQAAATARVVSSAQLLATGNNNNNDEPPSSSSSSIVDRRSALEQGGVALSSLLLSSLVMNQQPQPAYAAPDYTESSKKQRILITGSNSGLGLDAAQRLVARGHEVVLACRTLEKANAAADRIKFNIANDSDDAVAANTLLKSIKLTPMECDLADLSSIDKFVNNLNGQAPFDAVCYNAGLARNTGAKDVARTKDGFELTVGTNHLGHFYLNHLLLPSMLNKDSGRIVVTASSVHDPDSPGGAQGELATLGDLKGFENAVAGGGSKQFDMVDGGEFNADKAYKDSKLCNVLFTRELQRRLEASGSNIKVNSFTPGLIVSSGLFRDQNKVFTKVFDVAATKILKVGESIHYGGGALEYMTLSAKVGEKGGMYYYSAPGSGKYGDDAYGKQFDASEVSKEARESDEGKAKRFWELSEKLVGI
mmetsp:Transcript_3486/g.7693  ORF Transcript_3486/g.7693 Transcript_3486/m.7693 type:complete len:446 (+) Transcript_3486:62-1399(+)|eukprot:CAMPEP_0172316338 /NCGR_PEP_ID=MMETSP1058-20130122/27837_1 /TAXON_ID=83371 /ORGANISM="Detonula confervacea, Strain CCMP 353" /LENGTH=445 /DNA_ID=CAMNT_0013030621 /DNA_START=24 /DNA_END=1361 /DNA_ORIENTATION=+